MVLVQIKTDGIDAVGYDDKTKELYVKFNDRAVNKFDDIDLEIFTELLYSKSKEQFIQSNLYDRHGFSIVHDVVMQSA